MTNAPLYTAHERIWHWLQAAAILLLLVTGAEVHAPETFHLLGFSNAVIVHNTVALLLVIHAFLGLFYFLTSGMIRQYIPGEHSFMKLAFEQARFYMRGIFRGEPHPGEHDRDHKLNPLQKLTYLAILNVLLPVQILSGALIWSGGRWPGLAERFGGLPVLVPLHVAAAWLFLAFVLMHIYLTTTGETPLSNLRAMFTGGGGETTDLSPEPAKEEAA